MMHRQGAFKTPGGKLVAVDFAIEHGRMRDVQVHGDFFLHPQESLAAIASSLEGAPVDLSDEELAQRIAGCIPAGTEWLGSSPQALAGAVRRALDAPEEETPAGGGERGFS
jgi:lipoate-protein ligase A